MSPHLREDVDAITGTKNREIVVLGRKSGGAMVFALQSRQSDNLLRYIFRAVDEAARRQLSTKRPGMVLVGLEGISASELVQTAQQDRELGMEPTALRVWLSVRL